MRGGAAGEGMERFLSQLFHTHTDIISAYCCLAVACACRPELSGFSLEKDENLKIYVGTVLTLYSSKSIYYVLLSPN